MQELVKSSVCNPLTPTNPNQEKLAEAINHMRTMLAPVYKTDEDVVSEAARKAQATRDLMEIRSARAQSLVPVTTKGAAK